MLQDLDPTVLSALIIGLSTIIASFIAIAGAFVIVHHRKTVINLCEQVESYFEMEQWLVRKLLESQKRDTGSNNVKTWKGKFRSEALGETRRPKMTKKEAQIIRKRYFG